MTLRALVVATALLCGAVAPNLASADDAAAFKSDIDAFFERMEIASDGRLHWSGADSIDVRQDGDGTVATIVNGHLSLRQTQPDAKPLATIVLDRIELRRHPAATGKDMVDLAVSLPALATITTAEDDEITLSLKDAKATILLEGAAERQRAVTLDIAGGRLDEKTKAASATFGPVTGHVKTIRNDDASWRAPIDFELKSLEFLIPQAPLAGTVERIAYTGETAGSDLAAADAFRDKAAELREDFRDDPRKRAQESLALLPAALNLSRGAKGDLTVEGVTAKRPGGETLVALAKGWLGGAIGGLDGDKAAYRITLGHDGLTLAPSLLPDIRVPRSVDLDFGFEDIAVATLRNLAEITAKLASAASADERQRALPELIATAMSLRPVFRIYDAMVNFKDVGIDGSGEAKRAPPPPLGYAADGDITIRGFDALPEVMADKNDRGYLALLKFLGERATSADGAEVAQFHLTSQPGKTITINGNDISDWFQGAGQFGRMPAAPPRLLRLADPPEQGDDVRAVQKIVMTDGRTDGVYDLGTALAVMRFQKAQGLNISGVVDAATHDKLGLPPPPPAPKN